MAASKTRSPTRFGRHLALLTLAGLAARIAFLLLEPRADLAGDESTWTALAFGAVLRGHHPFSPLKSPILFYPPAYPYFIAAAVTVLGSLQAVKWAQAVLGALLVPAVGRAGAHVVSERAALFAAGASAFYPELVWFSVHFWSETLFLVLLWWGFERVLAARAGSRLAAAAGGLLFGLATLTRETALYFAPVAALFLAWPAAEGKEPRPRAAARWPTAAAFLLAILLTVLPWTWRNWAVFHAFVPVSTFGAHSLWQGNTRLPLDEFYRQTDSVQGPIPQYRLARARALEDIRARQPLWIFEKLRVELPELWAPASHVFVLIDRDAYGPVGPAARGLVRAATIAPYLALMALAVPGLASLGGTPARIFLLAFFVYYNAIHVVTYGQDRFRLPMMPVVFLAAGHAWTAWREGTLPAWSGRRGVLLYGLAALTAAVVLPGFF